MKQLKARITNLEKSYEVLKQRHKESDDGRKKLQEENQKLQEDMQKEKSKRTRLQKELSEAKNNQASAAASLE